MISFFSSSSSGEICASLSSIKAFSPLVFVSLGEIARAKMSLSSSSASTTLRYESIKTPFSLVSCVNLTFCAYISTCFLSSVSISCWLFVLQAAKFSAQKPTNKATKPVKKDDFKAISSPLPFVA